MMKLKSNSLFHIHTYRCGHAASLPDETYVLKAIEAGAESIWFTDHAPFPGDPFGGRMKYEELKAYIYDMMAIREKYNGQIAVHIGLEIEFFPSFDRQGYYRELHDNKGIECLLLGQHMAEIGLGEYSFIWNQDVLEEKEHIVLGNAIVQGINRGYFDAVAHPDRIFRHRKGWDGEMRLIAEEIISAAKEKGIPLEQNRASKREKHQYWPEFWDMAERIGIGIIQGIDAHDPQELRL